MSDWIIKTKEDFNFRSFKQYDIEKLKNIFLDFDSEWDIDTSRQDHLKTHKDTKSYTIINYPLDWSSQDGYVPNIVCQNSEILSEIQPVITDLEKFHNGSVARVIVTKLFDEGNIPPHQDRGEYLITARRHHLPIVTNSRVMFKVGEDSVNMKAGECWEINNSKIHSVENLSDESRIHIIIDILPNKFLKEKEVQL